MLPHCTKAYFVTSLHKIAFCYLDSHKLLLACPFSIIRGEFSASYEIMKSKLSPFLWSGLVMVLALTLTLYVAIREKLFFEANQIVSPDISLGPIIAYFSGVVVVLALILLIFPLSKLRLVFRILFTLMFAWGVFIVIALILPPAAYPLAIIAGIAWLFWARVWLHDLLLLITLSGWRSLRVSFFSVDIHDFYADYCCLRCCGGAFWFHGLDG